MDGISERAAELRAQALTMRDIGERRGLVVTPWGEKDLSALPVASEKAHRGAILLGENPVHCKGEPLGRVRWQGERWAVTDRGIEQRDGCYVIAAHQLRDDQWPAHVANKGDHVGAQEFRTAYLVACALFNVPVPARVLTDIEGGDQ